MRKNFSAGIFLVLTFGCAISFSETQARTPARPSPTPSNSGHPTGRLIVQRAPNFGSELFIRLSIDGKRAADIPRNQHYGGARGGGCPAGAAAGVPDTHSRRPPPVRAALKKREGGIFLAPGGGGRPIPRPQ